MLLSIITVVFNGQNEILQTLRSLNDQSLKDFEYIIIDGGSKDGTLSVINGFKSLVSYLVSEPDNGIYDAMNKGISLSNGKYLYFLNAGDALESKNTISKIIEILKKADEDILHGSIKVDLDGNYWSKPLFLPEELWRTTNFCHQGLLIRSEYHKQHLYDLSYKIAADFKLAFDAYSNGRRFMQLNFPIAIYKAGGFSDKRRLEVLREKYKIISAHDTSFLKYLYYKYLLLDARLRITLKFILPSRIVRTITLSKYDNNKKK